MTASVTRFIASIPKVVVALLLVAAIVNLLIGVFLRYVMIPVTDWLDVDAIRFTWVEEVGEMMLAWLTLIGAAIGVRERAHFTLHVLSLSPAAQLWANRIHHALIAVIGVLAAWYGVKLCLLNRTLATPGLEINLAVLYASSVAGGVLLVVYALSMIAAPPPRDSGIVPLEVRAE
jgi:TRAP-type C4-dicarboxylate transport system permease small subunit